MSMTTKLLGQEPECANCGENGSLVSLMDTLPNNKRVMIIEALADVYNIYDKLIPMVELDATPAICSNCLFTLSKCYESKVALLQQGNSENLIGKIVYSRVDGDKNLAHFFKRMHVHRPTPTTYMNHAGYVMGENAKRPVGVFLTKVRQFMTTSRNTNLPMPSPKAIFRRQLYHVHSQITKMSKRLMGKSRGNDDNGHSSNYNRA